MKEEEQPPIRIVRCTIEMELIEGEHFNYKGHELTDEKAISWARDSFFDMLENMELDEYFQAKIIERIS